MQLGARMLVDKTLYSSSEQEISLLPNVGAELWLGFSAGSVQQPYHPQLYWTPYVRGFADFSQEEPSFSALFGFRVSYRVQGEPSAVVSAVESVQ